jgi:hypothetical protein
MPATGEMLATAGTQATATTKATTVMPTAAEMPITVLSPTLREFSRKFAENWSEQRRFVNKYKEKK